MPAGHLCVLCALYIDTPPVSSIYRQAVVYRKYRKKASPGGAQQVSCYSQEMVRLEQAQQLPVDMSRAHNASTDPTAAITKVPMPGMTSVQCMPHTVSTTQLLGLLGMHPILI